MIVIKSKTNLKYKYIQEYVQENILVLCSFSIDRYKEITGEYMHSSISL